MELETDQTLGPPALAAPLLARTSQDLGFEAMPAMRQR